MVLVVLQEDIEPLPRRRKQRPAFNNEGILSSVYKEETKANYFNSNPQSIFAAKQRVKHRLYDYGIGAESLIKFTVFLSIIAIAIA